MKTVTAIRYAKERAEELAIITNAHVVEMVAAAFAAGVEAGKAKPVSEKEKEEK